MNTEQSIAKLTLVVDKNTELYEGSFCSLKIEISGNNSDTVAIKLCTYGSITSFANFHVEHKMFTEAIVKVMPKDCLTVPLTKLEGFLEYFCKYPAFGDVLLMPAKEISDLS